MDGVGALFLRFLRRSRQVSRTEATYDAELYLHNASATRSIAPLYSPSEDNPPLSPLFSIRTPTMSLDPPTYLNSLQNNIRARPIPWEGAVRAGTITDNELKKIKAVDKVRKEQRKQTVESDLASYRSLLVGGNDGKSVLESAAKRADVIQYILVLAGDLINGANSRYDFKPLVGWQLT